MENKIIINQTSGDGVGAWDSGFPIGNGRLGAMIPGSVGRCETINFNQDTVWYGPKLDRDNPDAIKYYKEIRELIKNHENMRADKLCYMAMTSMPKYFGAYEPLGKLVVYHNHDQYDYIRHQMLAKGDIPYERVLDLESAVATVENTLVSEDAEKNGVRVKREYFVSAVDGVFAFRITADKPILDMHTNFMRRPCEMTAEKIGDLIHNPGKAGPDGVNLSTVIGGRTNGKMEVIGDHLGFSEASVVEIYLAASSDFYVENPKDDAIATVRAAMKYTFDELMARHAEEHKALFNRSSIEFSAPESDKTLPERLKDIKAGKHDASMLELFYNVGKYILINSSREGSQPANLQGIWNAAFAAPWECNYTVNINLQCNYWIAESAGLSECHMPLFDLIERMVPNGEKTAKKVYGCDGFVAHHTTNLWGDTSIEGNSFPSSVWPMGGTWLILHMWDHYLYTGDKEFLRKRAFPVMKKNAIFLSQYLFPDSEGYYITGPSLSPENPYKAATEKGYVAKHCNGPEIDNQLTRALLKSLLSAYDVLGIEDEDKKTFEVLLTKIRTPRVNKNGAILEWNEDFEEENKEHRHLSHLFALYPYYDIDLERTPELAKAAEKTLDIRFANEDGKPKMVVAWSDAWAAACYAKLGMPEKAVEHIYTVMAENSASMLSRINMGPAFCVFQIDGNMTSAAAITEMLLQSDEERIKLLPALSEEMQNGSLTGLVARGGFVIDAKWQGGKATKASVTSKLGGVCRIKAKGLSGVDTEYNTDGDYIVFNTEKGKKYELSF